MGFDSSRFLDKRLFTRDQLITFLVIVCLVPLFEPRSIAYVPSLTILNPIYTAGKILSGCIVLAMLLKSKVINAFSASVVVLSLVVLVSTVLNGQNAREWLSEYVSFCLIALLIVAMFRDHRKAVLRGVQVVTSALLLLNMISMLVYPEGMYAQTGAAQYNNYFWGHRNNTYMLVLPAVISSLLLDRERGKRIGVVSVMIFACGFFEVVYRFSATSFLAMLLFSLGLLLVQSKRIRGKLNLFTYCGAYVIAFVAVVILRLQEHFSAFFEDFLGRSVTLTGRTTIWDYVFQLMQGDHAGLGYGLLSKRLLQAINPQYSHAHNMLLDVWFCGGYIAVIVFAVILFVVAKRLYSKRSDMSAAIIALGIGCLLLVGITERTSCEALYVLLAYGFAFGESVPGRFEEGMRVGGISRTPTKRLQSHT